MENRTPQWDLSASVGNPILDEQHRKMLAACRTVADLVSRKSATANDDFHERLNDFYALAALHIRTEEGILEKNQFPDLGQHRAEHRRHMDNLVAMLLDATKGHVSSDMLYSHMYRWITEHELGTDIGQKEYLRD